MMMPAEPLLAAAASQSRFGTNMKGRVQTQLRASNVEMTATDLPKFDSSKTAASLIKEPSEKELEEYQ